MKIGTIKFQKIIMFIPYVNTLNFFIWYFKCNARKTSFKAFIQGGVMIAGYVLIGTAFFIAIDKIMPSAYEVMPPLEIYILPMLMSYGSIRHQKKLIAVGELIE